MPYHRFIKTVFQISASLSGLFVGTFAAGQTFDQGISQLDAVSTLLSNPENVKKLASLTCPEMHVRQGNRCGDDTENESGTTFVQTPFGEMEVSFHKSQGHTVTEGDILLREEEEAPTSDFGTLGAARNASNYLWPNAIVPYVIDSSLPNSARVTESIAHWQTNTPVRFVRRTNQRNYIVFMKGTGCSSYVGMQGGRQTVYLSNGCSTGNTIHEIGHALGLWHEQSRFDRDKFVKIHWNNIRSGQQHNFNTMGSSGNANFGGYDFNSIMHYGSYSFSGNGRPTITKWDGSLVAGQRNGLPRGDIDTIKRLYSSR